MNDNRHSNFSNDQSFSGVEELFREAAGSEPELRGDNFTKIVLNRLPSIERSSDGKRWLTDFFGIAVALVLSLSFIDPNQLFAQISAAIPNSIVVSFSTVLTTSLALVLASTLAWWTVERSN